MFREITRCRICGNPRLRSILNLGRQSLTGVFPQTRDQAVTCGPLELVQCDLGAGGDHCGLVQLRQSYDSAEMYGENYGYRSSLNSSMVDHLRAKAVRLTRRANLAPGDCVLDIGSNDGTLLSFYPTTTARVGIDPSAAKFRQFYQPGIEVVADFFSADAFRSRFLKRKAKLVTSIAMFYDLERPIEFVEQVGQILAEDGLWHLEQSYLPAMLAQNAYDTICHEHVEYYTLWQIEWMAKAAGLRVIDVEINSVNGGSFAVTLARGSSSHEANDAAIAAVRESERRGAFDSSAPYERFRAEVFAHRDELRSLLDSLNKGGKLVLGYGASTKGNVLLQFCGIAPADLPCILEVNPDKFGRFTPGTLIPIVSEAEGKARRPDYLLVFPWHFRENLLRREAEYLRGGGRMIFPLPKIGIVPP